MTTRTRRAAVGIVVIVVLAGPGSALGGGFGWWRWEAQATVTNARMLRRLDERVHELERGIDPPRRRERTETTWLPIIWFALAGAAAAVVVTALEQRREPTRSRRADAVSV